MSTFYSALLTAVTTARGAPKLASALLWQQWLDGAQRRGEFKQGERDWLGLDAWLDQQHDPISRQALADYVRAAEVRIVEVVLSLDNNDALPAGWTVREVDDHFEVFDEEGSWQGGGWTEREATEDALDPDRLRAKYDAYRAPGGANYRELLLALPDKAGAMKSTEDRLATMNAFKSRMRDTYGPNWLDTATPAELEENRALSIAASGSALDAERSAYRSSHWEQPNVLAHVRFDERTDVDGKRVLFLQEIQSDWHQQGRLNGYVDPLPGEVQRAYQEALASFLESERRSENAGVWRRNNHHHVTAMRDYEARQEANGRAVPNAPLKHTGEWAMLAFKRMVRWGVDNGFDCIAWTTGEQAAELFDLSKRIAAVQYDGTSLVAYDHSGEQVIGRTVAECDLSGYIGKDATGKLLAKAPNADGERNLSGLDLKVGGAGLRAFYDKILPAAVGKWAKAFGATVGRVDLSDVAAAQQRNDDLALLRTLEQNVGTARPTDGMLIAHSIDVPPALREAVRAGQPLFQMGTQQPRGQLAISTGEGDLTARRFHVLLGSGADASTFLHESAHIYLEWLREIDAWLRPQTARSHAQQGLMDDIDATLRWFGVARFEDVSVSHHERFAEAYEGYVRTGQAPVPGLVGAFKKLGGWLKALYRSAKELPGSQLSPEVREIFDRMVAKEPDTAVASPYGRVYAALRNTGAPIHLAEAQALQFAAVCESLAVRSALAVDVLTGLPGADRVTVHGEGVFVPRVKDEPTMAPLPHDTPSLTVA